MTVAKMPAVQRREAMLILVALTLTGIALPATQHEPSPS